MTDSKPALPLWPFFVADILLLGLAALLLRYSRHPLAWQEAGLIVLCGALGCWSLVMPFLRRDANHQALAQFELLTEATRKVQKLDELASQIYGATAHWAELQTHTTKSAEIARDVFTNISSEAKAFTELLQKAGDAERNHLRLEVDKLRRGEKERLQVVTHILDHVHALYKAAQQSGQAGLIEQVGQFQNACRDAARRIGLVQTFPVGEPFDARLHQLPENVTPVENAAVTGTIIPGYTYQGQLLRRPLVTLQATE